jgi:hypothetical protein
MLRCALLTMGRSGATTGTLGFSGKNSTKIKE